MKSMSQCKHKEDDQHIGEENVSAMRFSGKVSRYIRPRIRKILASSNYVEQLR